MSDAIIESNQQTALETLKQHGKTFNFARLFLPKDTGNDAAILYQFCRYVDDVVDEAQSKAQATKSLEEISLALRNQDNSSSVVGPFIDLCRRHQIPTRYGLHLVHGVGQDLSQVSLKTTDELIQYSYYVAGVVGLMMAPILGADRDGRAFAVDLGIAMQLTNIARDVLEDAQNGRRYVPAEWVGNLSPLQIEQADKSTRAKMSHAIGMMLQLAEKYYKSAFIGLNYLPLKSRIAINVAAITYREIGRKLARNDYAFWDGRTVVPSWYKAILATKCVINPDSKFQGQQIPQHDSSLHQPIKCLINLA